MDQEQRSQKFSDMWAHYSNSMNILLSNIVVNNLKLASRNKPRRPLNRWSR